MRVLFTLHSHGCGGAEKHAFYLMSELAFRGEEVFFAGPLDSWLADQLMLRKVPCFHLPMHGFYDPWSLGRLTFLTKKLKIDLLHGHLMRGAFYAGLAGRLTGVPAVSTAHATNTWRRFNYSRKVIAVSQAVHKVLLSKGLPPEKVTTIYNGVPLPDADLQAERDAVRKQLGFSATDLVLCSVGRFIPDKGQDILIEALSRLQQERLGQGFGAVLVGEAQGSWYEKVRTLAETAGIDHLIRFVGFQQNVAKFLFAADIFVLPSRRESFGLVLLEAGAAGLPIVASRVGGIPEVVEEGASGILFAPEDVEELTSSLRTLMGDEQRRREMGVKSREIFSEKFSLATMVQGTMALYQELLASDGTA